MAHSGKTMTFATDLVPQEDNIYRLGNDSQRWKFYGELQPLITKIYNASLYNSSSGANYYQNFATVTPADYNALWIVHYRITITAEGHSDYTEICDVSISGRANTYYSYKIYNSIVNYSIYSHVLLNSNSATVPHELGYRMASSYGATNVSKVVKVELLEQINCTVTLLGNLKLYTSATPSGYTWRTFNATSNGLQETGDTNDTGQYILSNGFKGKAGSNKVYKQCLFARTGDGTYESFVMQNDTVAATKAVNLHGFVPDGKIYWNSSNTIFSEGTLNLNAYQQYHVIDYRYSFNFDDTFLPDYCETYVVYIYNEDDGLLYLDTTQWLAAALPTTADGKIYQRIGSKYYTGTTNYYQGSLLLDNPYYEFKNGKIRTWVPPTTAEWVGKGSHSNTITANEFNPAIGTLTLLGNVSNTTMPKTGNANAEMIIKAYPTNGTHYYEARLGFSSNGNLYYMPVDNTLSWKAVSFDDHTHTISLAEDNSTSQNVFTLEYDKNYKLTVDNSDDPEFIFATPAPITYSTVSKSAEGLCPQLPNETTTTKFLCQDGNWVVPSYIADTHHTAYLRAGVENGTANHETTTGKTYLLLVENGQHRSGVKLIPGSNMSITSDASGNVTFTSSYIDTKNTAGSTNSTSKLFLIGATSQDGNYQETNSNQYVFATDGALSAETLGINARTTADKVTLQWNNSALEFVFT